MSDYKYDVSVIIVTYNSMPALENSLKSLKSSDDSLNLEVILVDNNSSDDSIKVTREIFPDSLIIENKSNAGFAAACNQGAKAASSEYLLFFNPDLEIEQNAVLSMCNFCLNNQKVGAVGGRMRFPDGRFQPTCRNFPTASNIFYSRGSFLSKFFSKGEEYTLPDYPKPTEVEAVAGTLLMTPAEIFAELGGFDERYFMYMEDTDYCKKLAQTGYKNYFLPDAGGVHLWGEGSSGGNFLRQKYHHRSILRYFKKHHKGFFSSVILPIMLGINLFFKLIFSSKNHK